MERMLRSSGGIKSPLIYMIRRRYWRSWSCEVKVKPWKRALKHFCRRLLSVSDCLSPWLLKSMIWMKVTPMPKWRIRRFKHNYYLKKLYWIWIPPIIPNTHTMTRRTWWWDYFVRSKSTRPQLLRLRPTWWSISMAVASLLMTHLFTRRTQGDGQHS